MKIIVAERVTDPMVDEGSWKNEEWWHEFCYEDHDVDEIIFESGGKYRETWDKCWIEFDNEEDATAFLLRWR